MMWLGSKVTDICRMTLWVCLYEGLYERHVRLERLKKTEKDKRIEIRAMHVVVMPHCLNRTSKNGHSKQKVNDK